MSFHNIQTTLRFSALLTMFIVGTTVSAATVYVGQIASFTSSTVGSMSRKYNAGIKVAFDRANAAGGIKGSEIQLVHADDGFDASKTVAVVDDLVVKKNVLALIGVVGTPQVAKMPSEGTLQKYQLASIGPLTGLKSAQSSPNVFPVRGTYEDEVRAMSLHSAHLGRKSVLFVYYEAGAGLPIAKLAPEMAKESLIKLVGLVGYPVFPDFEKHRSAVAALIATQAERPESIVLFAKGPAHSAALKALREKFGKGMPIYSLGQVNPASLIKDVGDEMKWHGE